jgi:hypothetical protein
MIMPMRTLEGRWMETALWMAAILAGWLLLQLVILPRLGVPT